MIHAARQAEIGETRLDRIEVRGVSLADAAVKGFRLPPREHLEWRLPEWVRRFFKDGLTTRPVINHDACIQCGICQNHCPQQAIETRDDRLLIRYRTCIRCFCCQEFCPQGSITIGRGWILRLIRR